ncbi:MAG TPA: tetratricopeptide repeat protein [Ignavibacteriaceae bacterium]|nr:tetratricopeptide repeat protein [Ignavibacteriaceae bacterium]
MVRFCPGCGNELKSEFKFCPSCGYNLQKLGNQQTEEIVKMIECANCGTENPVNESVCSGCGMKLKGEVKDVSKPISVSHEKIQKPVKKNQVVSGAEDKVVNPKKIIGISGAVISGCFIILFAAGVFDKPVSNINTSVTQNQNQNSGIDLSAVNRINELETMLKTNPNNNEALLELAHLRNDSGMFEKAIENYQEYLKRVPSDADSRIDMGVCYYNLGKYDEAIAAMTKALEYNKDHQIGHLNLGIVNLASGNVEKSREWLQKAVSLGPETDVGKRAQELLKSH